MSNKSNSGHFGCPLLLYDIYDICMNYDNAALC